MIALRRAIVMTANPVVSLHAHRLFSGRACSCKKDLCCYYHNHFYLLLMTCKRIEIFLNALMKTLLLLLL